MRNKSRELYKGGAEPNLVHELLNNPDHSYYVGPHMPGFTMTLDLSEAAEKVLAKWLENVDQDDSINSKEHK